MTEINSYLPGTACWIDLGSPDPDASAAFYRTLFGWDVLDLGPDAGGYRMCSVKGRTVAGIGPQQNPDLPPWWTTYFSVASVEVTCAAVVAHGGTIIAPPMDVMEAGRMAVAADPSGAVFSLWQAGEHPGIGVAGELGTRCWAELNTRDTAGAAAFYGAVFGWTAELADGPMHYTQLYLGAESATKEGVGGMLLLDDSFPPEIPNYWAVYFYTPHLQLTFDTAVQLGSSVAVPPMPIPGVGSFAVLHDPQGSTFSLLQPDQPA